MATENRHIEQIYNTRANLQSNLDNGQIGIETDGTESLVYKDDDGTYHIVANTAEAASFTNLTATGNLTIAAAMYHSGDTDTYFTFADDQATLVCGGVSMIDFLETTQDVITVNAGSVDVDFVINWDGGVALFERGSDGFIGVANSTPRSALDVNGTVYLGSQTDDAVKSPKIVMSQYDSGTENEGWLLAQGYAEAAAHTLDIGGGVSAYNAATLLRLFTAADVSTRTGVSRLSIDEAGNITANPTSVDSDFTINWDSGVALFSRGSDGWLGAGTTAPEGNLHLYSDDVANTTIWHGIYNQFTKRTGASDAADSMYVTRNNLTLDMSGGAIGATRLCSNLFTQTAGDVGTGASAQSLHGLRCTFDLNAGNIYGECIGVYNYIDQESAHTITQDALLSFNRFYADGDIGGNLYGGYFYISQLAGKTITGETYCLYVGGDFDGTTTGTVYGIRIAMSSGFDYGIYQTGTSTNGNYLADLLVCNSTIKASDFRYDANNRFAPGSGRVDLIAAGNGIYFNGTNFYPASDDNRILGDTSNRWNKILVGTGDSTFAGNIYLADDKALGISGGARLVFDATATPDSITVTDADLWVGDGKYIGLGAAKGRILFTDTTIDTFTIKDADIYMDGEKANVIGVAQSVTDTTGNDLTIHAGAAKATTADLAGGTLTLAPGVSTGTGIAKAVVQRCTRQPATGTSANAKYDAIIVAPTKHMSNNTDTDLFEIALGTLQGAGGSLHYSCQVSNGTDIECHTGVVMFAALRKDATYQTAIDEVDRASGGEVECHTTLSAMSDSFTMTSGSGKATVRAKFNTGMGGTIVMTLHYTLFNDSIAAITLL
jgi:hypothetical protein